jgi:uncharacterized protein (DUF924 family)
MLHKSKDILDFWFTESGPEKWYTGGAAFDAEIREKYQTLWQDGRDGHLSDWAGHPRKALALIIVLDQFPRNMFRNDPQAFATDQRAKSVACSALKHGWDTRFPEPDRQFFYMPFMHSESLPDQDHSVRLMCQKMPENRANSLLHARAHREIIRRFGRFPYRNEALGRKSSAEEKSFLSDGGYGKMLEQVKSAA